MLGVSTIPMTIVGNRTERVLNSRIASPLFDHVWLFRCVVANATFQPINNRLLGCSLSSASNTEFSLIEKGIESLLERERHRNYTIRTLESSHTNMPPVNANQADAQRCFKRGSSWRFALLMALMMSCPIQFVDGFSMKYQPPVKSSVNSLYGGRRSRQTSSSSTKTTPRKSAYSGTLSMPPFEQRMKEMVLRNPTDALTASTRRRRALPKNVLEVESLQDYKDVVVGNPKIVVVRFHASYCKVSRYEHIAHSVPNLHY